jgi:alpha-L-fucosidase 2
MIYLPNENLPHMKLKILLLQGSILLLLSIVPSNGQNSPSGLKIWFNKPADSWNDALPVGNGRLGAMIFGGIEKEHLQLNEESVWTGKPRWDANPDALKSLPKVRKLLFEGKYTEAEKLALSGIMGSFRRDEASTYQTLGDLTFDFGHVSGVSGFRRELDIGEAISRVIYTADQISFIREVFSSAPDQALVIRFAADKPEAVTFTARLSRPGNKARIKAEGNEIIMNEHIGDGTGVRMETRLRIVPEGGTIIAGGDSIRVSKANSVSVFLTAATDYSGEDPTVVTGRQMENILKKSYSEIRKKHIADYQSLFKRVSLDLGSGDGNYFTTDARITAMQNGYDDPDLIELYYQFGRYLLISSSRPGDLPANLQGIWADGL